jgi:hypothetical protein
MRYIISGMIKVFHTETTYPTFWSRLFNRPVPRQIERWERATLIVKTTKPIFNEVELLEGGNMVLPQIEQISGKQYENGYTTTTSPIPTSRYSAEEGITNLLLNTQKTHPNP